MSKKSPQVLRKISWYLFY